MMDFLTRVSNVTGLDYKSIVPREQAELIEKMVEEIENDNRSWSETVQIGDWVDSSDDGCYTFSGHQYKTKGKLYQVRAVDKHGKRVMVDGDYKDPNNPNPEKVWLGPNRVIVRNREIVWESSLQKSINQYDLTTLDDENRKQIQEMKYIPDLSNVP